MSVVRINAITVPRERAEELERRFAARAGEVSKSPGFEAFFEEIAALSPQQQQDIPRVIEIRKFNSFNQTCYPLRP